MEHHSAITTTHDAGTSAIDLTTSESKPLIITSLIEDGLWNLGDQDLLARSVDGHTKPKQKQSQPFRFEFASVIRQVPSQNKLPDPATDLSVDPGNKVRLPDFDRHTVSASSSDSEQSEDDALEEAEASSGSHIMISDDEEVSVRPVIDFGPRCPSCGHTDHEYESCPSRRCGRCDALDEHWTRHCPDASQVPIDTTAGAERAAVEQVPINMSTFGTCDYCEQPGHRELWCPLAMNDTPYCKDCHVAGHYAEECRGPSTAGRSASARMPAAFHTGHQSNGKQRSNHDAADTRQTSRQLIFCYCCAATGHYGDDCPKNHRHRGSKGIFSNDYARACLSGLTAPT